MEIFIDGCLCKYLLRGGRPPFEPRNAFLSSWSTLTVPLMHTADLDSFSGHARMLPAVYPRHLE